MDDFAGKVAVVTGGASGIGLALARRAAAEGMHVVIGDVEERALERAREELAAVGADVLAVATDVRDPQAVESLAARTVDAHGGVHLFCNNAGVGAGGLSWEVPLSDWEWVLGVNLWGVVHGVRAFVPRLLEQEHAHIVNTASVAGLVAAPFMGPYNASKHAVVAISETLHHELVMHGGRVHVSVLCPGWVRTNIAESARNRPADLGGPPGPGEPALAGALSQVVAAGMAPDDVATKVFDAVRAERFWILTHEGDEWQASIEAVQRSLRERTNPTMQPFG